MAWHSWWWWGGGCCFLGCVWLSTHCNVTTYHDSRTWSPFSSGADLDAFHVQFSRPFSIHEHLRLQQLLGINCIMYLSFSNLVFSPVVSRLHQYTQTNCLSLSGILWSKYTKVDATIPPIGGDLGCCLLLLSSATIHNSGPPGQAILLMFG